MGQYVWMGFWVGLGAELQFALVWAVWRMLHSRIAHKLHDEHWWHVIGDYFK